MGSHEVGLGIGMCREEWDIQCGEQVVLQGGRCEAGARPWVRCTEVEGTGL